jgi:hypothetical protein
VLGGRDGVDLSTDCRQWRRGLPELGLWNSIGNRYEPY